MNHETTTNRSAGERRKQPEQVRRRLLDCAANQVIEHGLRGVTIQGVASAAGVTKGGLFHHFPSKEKLTEAVFLDQLDQLDAAIDVALDADDGSHGCFTRAYIAVTFSMGRSPTAILWATMAGDAALRRLWSDWMRDRLDRHRKTDSGTELEIVRYAVDGIWVADLWDLDADLRSEDATLRARLIGRTRKAPTESRGDPVP